MNIRNISYADMPTCVTNVGQSGLDHTGTDGLNWFSVSLCGLSMLRQATMYMQLPYTQSPKRQEKIYQHFYSIWQHLAAKCAFRALQRVAYGIDSGAAYCRNQQRGAANCAFIATCT